MFHQYRTRWLLLIGIFVFALAIGPAIPTIAAPLVQEDIDNTGELLQEEEELFQEDETEIGDILRDPVAFEDQEVTLGGRVINAELGRRAFVLGGEEDRFDLDRLPVLTDRPLRRDLETDERLDITGTVRRFDPETFEQEFGFQLEDEELSDALTGRAVLFATSVRERTD